MAQDARTAMEGYSSDDPSTWGKLSSEIQFRSLHLLLLREILMELRKLSDAAPPAAEAPAAS
jgi:hypothetical protein